MFESYLKPPISFPTLTGSIVTFNSQYAGLPLKSHTVDIDSVSGVSAIKIWATGKNLWSVGDVSATRISLNDLHLPIGVYTFSAVATSTDTNYDVCGLIFEYDDGTNSPYYTIARNVRSSVQMTAEKPVRKIALYASTNYATSAGYSFTFTDIQIEIGNTATAYQPFGTTTTINIGQTVNEGEYNARTGVLEVTQPSVQTLQLASCPIDTLLGENNIWADTGNTTLQYIKLG